VKTLRLASVAAQAEQLRLRRLAQRMARRAALLALAGLCFAFVLLALHVAAFVALARCMPADHAALWIAGADLLLGLIAIWFARRTSRPDAVEQEAKLLRDQALLPLYDTVTLGRLFLRAEGMWMRVALMIVTILRSRSGPAT
jgi:hypothetical protein